MGHIGRLVCFEQKWHLHRSKLETFLLLSLGLFLILHHILVLISPSKFIRKITTITVFLNLLISFRRLKVVRNILLKSVLHLKFLLPVFYLLIVVVLVEITVLKLLLQIIQLKLCRGNLSLYLLCPLFEGIYVHNDVFPDILFGWDLFCRVWFIVIEVWTLPKFIPGYRLEKRHLAILIRRNLHTRIKHIAGAYADLLEVLSVCLGLDLLGAVI